MEQQSNGERGIGMAGGISWTKHWLTFDNSFFHPQSVHLTNNQLEFDDLILFPTDKCLFLSPELKGYSELYASNQQIFFEEYAKAHKKMSELGVKWKRSEESNLCCGISLE